jgi:exodeoxyribonuclease VII small subunit
VSKQKGQTDAETIERMTFEQAVELLESINDRIESGEIGLEQSLAEYERGMRLIAHCRRILDRAEERMAELTPGSEEESGEAEGASGEHDR